MIVGLVHIAIRQLKIIDYYINLDIVDLGLA